MSNSWKQSLKDAITDPKILLQTLELPASLLDDLNAGHRLFPLRVPKSFVARMEKGNPNDPLLMQVLPLRLEEQIFEGFVEDPLEEQTQNPLPGLLHKYKGRILLIASGACAVNCRYCFRRSFPYEENNPGTQGWDAVLDYVKKDKSISEVILSGGDPLTLTDTSLQKLIRGLEQIPHVTTLRIHSRIPVVLPERVDDHFCALFKDTRLLKVMVIHVNHPNELNDDVHHALQKLKACNFTLLNHAVLLRGINDDPEIQIALQRKLFAFGVLPYYLNLLDKAQGTAHFDISLQQAEALLKIMIASLPGYLIPKLVREIPGEASKTSML